MLAEVHDLHIERREDLGRRAGLGKISAVLLDRMLQHAPPDACCNALHFVLPGSVRFFFSVDFMVFKLQHNELSNHECTRMRGIIERNLHGSSWHPW